MLTYIRLLLLPFSPMYGFIVFLRNKFYDWGIFKSTAFNLPVIGVGNLVLGGAGKTPVTEYLVQLLAHYKVAILSRGYGRKTTGFILADARATAQTIGDEPLQYFKKFAHVTVAVCEDRVKGIEALKQNHDVILLDDAYQHRRVRAGFNILLFEFDKLTKWQFLLPAGNLREPFAGYKRANAILVTKSPALLNKIDQLAANRKFDLNVGQRLSFSSLNYGALISLFNPELKADFAGYEVFMLTGIANPQPMFAYLSQLAATIHQFDYPDHHTFTLQDLKKLQIAFEENTSDKKIIITTEKDTQRLLTDDFKDLLLNLPIFYLPITVVLAPKDKLHFDTKIIDYVTNTKRIS